MKKICHFLFSVVHPSWCFYAGVVGVIIGTAASLFSKQVIFSGVIWLVTAICMLTFSIFISRRILVVVALVAGIILANVRIAPEFYGREVFSSLVGQEVRMSGTINEDPHNENGNVELRLKDILIDFQNHDPLQVVGTVYVQLNTKSNLERSDRITLTGKLSAGFGVFYGTLYRPELLSITRAEYGDIFARIKREFASVIKKLLPPAEANLGLGYLVGDKSGLSEEFSEQLRAVGMTHVVVASGAHLGILVGAIRKIFGRISRFAGVIGATLAIFAFAMVVGFTPSMTRAVLVALLSILVGYVGRSFSPLRLILFVAAITLLITPMNLFNLGWQLSFASFFAILALVPQLGRVLYGGKSPPWLASMLMTSIMTSITCAPILIYNFGTVSLLSLVANLIILPTLPYVMLLVLLTGVTSPIPYLAAIISKLAMALLDLHITVIKFLSEQKVFIMDLPTADFRFFGIYLPLIGWLGWMILRQRKHHDYLSREDCGII